MYDDRVVWDEEMSRAFFYVFTILFFCSKRDDEWRTSCEQECFLDEKRIKNLSLPLDFHDEMEKRITMISMVVTTSSLFYDMPIIASWIWKESVWNILMILKAIITIFRHSEGERERERS